MLHTYKREGLALLDEILTKTEDILIHSKVATSEKNIHREIKEGFLLKTKTEALIQTISSMYHLILEIDALKTDALIWNNSQNPSPFLQQTKTNLARIKEEISKMHIDHNK
ncbi:hypothetical protein NEOKW01_0908 [Nematocida sp. AWRm80]|nr:hypothetical protein NEOKW01_0908 [Nematocida sp. AWRm80]